MNRPSWQFILLRLTEAGTWRALSLVLLSLGIQIPDATWAHIALAGTAIAGLVSVFIPELGSPVTVDPAQIREIKSAPADTAPAAPRIPVTTIGQQK